jgi:hypothetical protein
LSAPTASVRFDIASKLTLTSLSHFDENVWSKAGFVGVGAIETAVALVLRHHAEAAHDVFGHEPEVGGRLPLLESHTFGAIEEHLTERLELLGRGLHATDVVPISIERRRNTERAVPADRQAVAPHQVEARGPRVDGVREGLESSDLSCSERDQPASASCFYGMSCCFLCIPFAFAFIALWVPYLSRNTAFLRATILQTVELCVRRQRFR